MVAAMRIVGNVGGMDGHNLKASVSTLTGTTLFLLLISGGPLAAVPALGPDTSIDPARFRVTTFATGLAFPTSMQQLSDGSLLVGTSITTAGSFYRSTGELRRLVDADHNGVADDAGTVLYTGLPGAISSVRQAGNLLFVTSAAGGHISMLRAGPTPASTYSLLGSIDIAFPTGWEHTSYALAVRPIQNLPDSFDLLFNIGSRQNNATSTDTVNASGLINATLQPDSIYKVTVTDALASVAFTGLTQVASGLRNAAGIAFDPRTGDLYFQDNGIDGIDDPNTPLSADELNKIAAADVGASVVDFGFAETYTHYPDGTQVGSGGQQPTVKFLPIGDSKSEGATEIAFAPAGFPEALFHGVFVGFHGRFNDAGLANDENPLIFVDFEGDRYFDFIGNDEPQIGHLDGLLATYNSLYVSDIASSGSLSTNEATGVIYQIQAIPEPTNGILLGGALLASFRRRRHGWRRLVCDNAHPAWRNPSKSSMKLIGFC